MPNEKVDSVKSSAGSETFSAACIERLLRTRVERPLIPPLVFYQPVEIGHS